MPWVSHTVVLAICFYDKTNSLCWRQADKNTKIVEKEMNKLYYLTLDCGTNGAASRPLKHGSAKWNAVWAWEVK